VDPTGVGDAYRAGFLVGIDSGLPVESAAQLASLIATAVLESSGAQEWTLSVDDGIARLAETYGPGAVEAIEPVLRASLDGARGER
jgi:adenosine kinase